MKVAVVGGGVFGCAIAVDLATAGATVELYESRPDIIEGTTARNMLRLHSGYHYPRSDTTAQASRDAAVAFARRWSPAVLHDATHHYVVADGSKVTPADYLSFLARLGLPYEVVDAPHVHAGDLTVRVPEAFVDVDVLRRVLRADLRRARVVVHTGQRVDGPEVPGHDVTVWTTYGVPWVRPLRYEVCEVALLELGRYGRESYVVVDGEFVSLDPHGRLHTLYDVRHSVHHVSEGTKPEVPPEYRPLLARGLVRAGLAGSGMSHFPAMVESASRFLWGLEPGGQHTSIYHGSLWSLRAVLPDVDATDERPTLVDRDGNVIRVLSGKVCTAATVGQAVVDEVFGLVPA